MNQDKAREFFSAYYEGTLDPGLRQALELRLNNDPTLQSDYAAFVGTMEELDALSLQEIEVPMFLSDRISARMEQDRASRRQRVPIWTLWLRGLAFGGLATAAIAGAFLSLGSRDDVAKAGIVGSSSGDQPSFAVRGSSVVLDYHPSSPHTVIVSSGVTGREIARFSADAKGPYQPLRNDQAGTALFGVQVQGEPTLALVAVPGSGKAAVASGEGTLKEFAVAVADRYRTPVIIRVANPDERMQWNLEGTDGQRAAESALKESRFEVDQRDTGILNITER